MRYLVFVGVLSAKKRERHYRSGIEAALLHEIPTYKRNLLGVIERRFGIPLSKLSERLFQFRKDHGKYVHIPAAALLDCDEATIERLSAQLEEKGLGFEVVPLVREKRDCQYTFRFLDKDNNSCNLFDLLGEIADIEPKPIHAETLIREYDLELTSEAVREWPQRHGFSLLGDVQLPLEVTIKTGEQGRRILEVLSRVADFEGHVDLPEDLVRRALRDVPSNYLLPEGV